MSAADPTKRVFMTTADSSELLKKPDKNTGTVNGKSKSLRLELELFEPDEYKFPEFNYGKLVHIEKVNWTIFLLLRSTVGRKKKKERKESIFRFTLFRSLLLFVGLHLSLRWFPSL